MCHHVKFGSFPSNGVCIKRREPPWAWAQPFFGRGVNIHPSPHIICYPADFGRSTSNGTNVIKEICLKKNLILMSRLSRSLKVIGTDTDRSATCDFLLMFHSNNAPISCRFRYKRWFQSNVANFPTPCILRPSILFTLGIYSRGRLGVKKTRMMVLVRGRILTVSSAICVDTIYERDGRTYRHRATATTALTHSVAR